MPDDTGKGRDAERIGDLLIPLDRLRTDGMIFDTHAHYDDDWFDEDRTELLEGMQDAGIGRIVNIGSDWKSLEKTRALTRQYNFVYGAYGIHPDEIGDLNEERFAQLRDFLVDTKAVALGEIGLDYYHNTENKAEQNEWFERQAFLAKELGLPIVIHSREAAEDTMTMAKTRHFEDIGGVVHCFSYSREIAREYVKMGFFIGVGGVVTYKNGRRLKETVEDIPLSSVVLETDSPYLSPEPRRGRRNDSRNLHEVVRMIAELKGITEQEVEEVTWNNACRLYDMDAAGR